MTRYICAMMILASTVGVRAGEYLHGGESIVQKPMSSAALDYKKLSGKVLKIIPVDDCCYYQIMSGGEKYWVSKCLIQNDLIDSPGSDSKKLKNFIKVGDRVVVEYVDMFCKHDTIISEIDVYAKNYIALASIGKVD